MTNEWAGLIGANKDHIYTGEYWMLLWTLLAFMLTIFAMKGVEEVQHNKVGFSLMKQKPDSNEEDQDYITPSATDGQGRFEFKHPHPFNQKLGCVMFPF
ncbi:hypothetical protein GLW08_09940 [Pontibacillus yanchengensis]|uniref:Uncharacterized protein n=1 Tax=Pontibacillus yanchengensis TaxID=462910 RepID=A0ACC7VHJ9_9BACI|nr:hypothetical protein [Pontibacillus yanchengensis]MYL53656.1 hypothetical protein [Pontibacillus yanchengensis]